MNGHYTDPNLYGGRFSEPEELEKDYTEVVYENTDNPQINQAAGLGIRIRQDKEGNVTGALVDGGDTNSIIISSTGARKTRSVLSHYILSCIYALQGFVVHDPKGEILAFFYSLLEKMGYNIRVLDLREPMKGDRLNFLQDAATLWKQGKRGRALEIARGIAQILYSPLEEKNDLFWTQASINLFLCYFTIAASIYEPDFVTLQTIYRLHIEGQERKHGTLNILAYLEEHRNDPCYELGIPSFTAPNETRQSVFAVFTSGLVRVVMNEEIADMTTQSTFSVRDLASGNKPTALFIITRDEAPQTYSTVVAAFVDMIYTTLIDIAHSSRNNRLERPVHFILEEFGNIAKLENINDMMTASRSRGIRIIIILQSLCQAYLTYSKELAHVLIGNAQNLIYMASTDMELVKMISERCGTRIDPYTHEQRPLLSPDRLTHLEKKKGETLMLLDRHYPYISCLPDLSMYKMIRPVERVCLPEREKVKVDQERFLQLIDELYEQRMKDMMENGRGGHENEMMYGQMSIQKMLDMPKEQKVILDEMIRDNRG